MMTMLTLDDALPNAAVILNGEADDWQEAVTLAGQALNAAGFSSMTYAEEMIEAVNTLGPYMVIAPGLALAHSRPSPAVVRTGLSWVRLINPVNFGSKNDPVNLVVGLAATDEHEHLSVMALLAKALSDTTSRASLEHAESAEQIREILTNAGGI